MGPVGKNQFLIPAGCLVRDGGAVCEALALAWGLPGDFARGFLDCNERAFAVLIIIQHDQVAVNNGRCTKAMAAFDGAEVTLPKLFAGMRNSGKLEALWGAPGKIHTIRVGRWSAGGKAIFLVVPVMFRLVINCPDRLSGMGMNGDSAAGAVFFIGAEKKHLFAPNDRRSVAGRWEWGFPFEMGIGPLDGQFGRAGAMALWAAESGPLFLGE